MASTDEQIAALTAQLAKLSGLKESQLTETIQTLRSVEGDDKVILNVGGTRFEVKKSTLAREPDSMLGAMFSGRFDLMRDEDGSVFIDRDPTHFQDILAYLRNGTFNVPTDEAERLAVLREADYFRLEGLIDILGGQVDPLHFFHESTINARREEDRVRKLFYDEPIDKKKIADPFIHLIKVYADNNLDSFKFPTSPAPQLYPVILERPGHILRQPGDHAIAGSLNQFKKQFKHFTANVFDGFNWSNWFTAGGAVLGSLLPVPVTSHADLTKYYIGQKRPLFEYPSDEEEDEEEDEDAPPKLTPPENTDYLSSDIDLFIHGISDPKKALAKIKKLHEHLSNLGGQRRQVPIVRTQRTITLVPGWPYRNIQVILRLYQSPAEVLIGFDLDCVGVGFDGEDVYAMPRARRALVSGTNLADPTRQTFRTATYENRLYKYSKRGFGIAIPGFDRRKINPEIYSKRYEDVRGLGRLLFLEAREKIKDAEPKHIVSTPLIDHVGFDTQLDLMSRSSMLETELADAVTEYDSGVLLPFTPTTTAWSIYNNLNIRTIHHWKKCHREGKDYETYFIHGFKWEDILDADPEKFMKRRHSWRFVKKYWTLDKEKLPVYTIPRRPQFVKSLKEYVGTLSDTPEDWYQDTRFSS